MFRTWPGEGKVFDPRAGAGSEDVGVIATNADLNDALMLAN
ncbi:hypothetical protein [Nocardioides houyundeii]|nr:hypothetical protein [Nocardioides houyundeii]